MIYELKGGGKLFIGDIVSSTNLNILDKNKINIIINCTNDLPFINDKYEKYRCGIDDFSLDLKKENDKFKLMIDYYLKIIDNGLKKNKNILIHCRNGMQRSATMVAAYLIKYHSFKKEEAIKYIKMKRWIAFKPKIIYKSILN